MTNSLRSHIPVTDPLSSNLARVVHRFISRGAHSIAHLLLPVTLLRSVNYALHPGHFYVGERRDSRRVVGLVLTIFKQVFTFSKNRQQCLFQFGVETAGITLVLSKTHSYILLINSRKSATFSDHALKPLLGEIIDLSVHGMVVAVFTI